MTAVVVCNATTFAPVATGARSVTFARAKESKTTPVLHVLLFRIRWVPVERGEVELQQVFLAFEPEHLRERGILPLKCGHPPRPDIRLRAGSETVPVKWVSVFAFPGDVARKAADPTCTTSSRTIACRTHVEIIS